MYMIQNFIYGYFRTTRQVSPEYLNILMKNILIILGIFCGIIVKFLGGMFMEEMKIPTMLSIRDTAKRTGLSATYIRKLCWDKKISYVKSGSKYLVNLEKFIEFLNKGEVDDLR